MPQRTPHSRAPLQSFEIYIFREGRWWLDSIFDDLELATYEARRMDESRRFSGVRVIEEIWNPDTDRATTRTVFRDAKHYKTNEELLSRNRAIRVQKASNARHRRERVVQGERARVAHSRHLMRRKAHPVRLCLILTAIVLGAIGAGLLLDRLERLVS